jgi:hypothetical protein
VPDGHELSRRRHAAIDAVHRVSAAIEHDEVAPLGFREAGRLVEASRDVWCQGADRFERFGVGSGGDVHGAGPHGGGRRRDDQCRRGEQRDDDAHGPRGQ